MLATVCPGTSNDLEGLLVVVVLLLLAAYLVIALVKKL